MTVVHKQTISLSIIMITSVQLQEEGKVRGGGGGGGERERERERERVSSILYTVETQNYLRLSKYNLTPFHLDF